MTARDARSDRVTDSTEATKRRPRTARTKAWMSSSSRPNEEEEDEYADRQDGVDFRSRLHQVRRGTQNNAGDGVSDYRIEPEPLEYSFEKVWPLRQADQFREGLRVVPNLEAPTKVIDGPRRGRVKHRE